MTKTTPIVLIASADDCSRQLAMLMLSQAGLRAESASNGQQALMKADGLVPAAVVADLEMPDMDGVTLRYYLRSQPRTRAIPLLIVSGSRATWMDAITMVGRVVRWQATCDVRGLAPAAPVVLN